MPTFGEKLKHARESRNHSIQQISGKTEIHASYLEALENNQFKELPGPAFGKFYIRAYASVLGFDPEPLLEEYDEEIARVERSKVGPPSAPQPARPRRLRREALIQSRKPRKVRAATEPAPVVPVDLESTEFSAAVRAEEPLISSRMVVDRTRNRRRQHEPRVTAAAPEPRVQLESTPEIDSEFRPGGVALLWLGVGMLLTAAVIGLFVDRSDATSLPSAPEGVSQPIKVVQAPPAELPAPIEPETRAIETIAQPPVNPDPAPPPVLEPPATTAQHAASGVSVIDSGLGSRIVDRRLEGETDRFEAGGTAVFSTRVVGGVDGQTIRHVWMHEGKVVQSIPLRLGGGHWRTHSRKTLWATGAWTVEARDTEGRALASASFSCVPKGS